MKRALIAIALAVGFIPGAAMSAWDASSLLHVQAQKGRPGGPPPERAERPRDVRQERPDDRRGRMTEDERRGLQRDLDKANREIYGGRHQK